MLLFLYLISQLQIGYWGATQQGKNVNIPLVLARPSGVSIKITAQQEGGYLNSVTTCSATVPILLQTMSVWVLNSGAFSFYLTWTISGT